MNLGNIPKELTQQKQWICCNADKVPMKADEPDTASATNPKTWSSFKDAVNAVHEGYYDYLGYVFSDNGYVGIDIDKGYDEDGLFISKLAAEVINLCGSYTEKSCSGRGFHIILKGDLTFNGKNNRNGMEIYKSGRFFVTTGESIVFDKIITNQQAIDTIIERYFSDVTQIVENTIVTSRLYNPIWQRPGKTIQLKPTYPVAEEGCRNDNMTSLAGSLKNMGYEKADILDILTEANAEACRPPLTNRELHNIVNSVLRYKR